MMKSNFEIMSIPDIALSVGNFADVNQAHLTGVNIKVYLKLLEYALDVAERVSETGEAIVCGITTPALLEYCKQTGFEVAVQTVTNSLNRLHLSGVITYNPVRGVGDTTVTLYKRFFVKGEE